MSDLHVSEGRNPETKRFSRNEDFFFDEQFVRFLEHHKDPARWPGKRWHLIINGDFLDFLQVTSLPKGESDLSRDLKRPEYGLGCGEKESVFKLRKIMDGHWQFFEALAEFVVAGNVVSIGKGNHDVEFHYVRVRDELRNNLRRVYGEGLNRKRDPDKDRKLASLTDESIRFFDWFYYEKHLLWVEHGNQYDGLNNFKYWLAPLLPERAGWGPKREDEIDLPWGSLFVRYLFNRVETSVPYADNIKPQWKFISWFISYQPLRAIHFLFRDGVYMLKKMARASRPLCIAAYGRRKAEHENRIKQLAAQWEVSETDLQYLDALRARNVIKEARGRWRVIGFLARGWWFFIPLLVLILLVPPLASLVPVLDWLERFPVVHRFASAAGPVVRIWVRVFRWLTLAGLLLTVLLPRMGTVFQFRLRPKKKLSYLAEKAALIHERLNVRYVVMGHTHEVDLQSIGKTGEEYFNTGTWTKVFRPDEERLISEENELAFVQVCRKSQGDLKVKLLKWDDAAGEPCLVKLFE